MKLLKPNKTRVPHTYGEHFPLRLQPQHHIAYVMSPRLGDTLIAMVVVNNLFRNQFKVTVFSDQLMAIKSWFPWVEIFPRPDEKQIKEILQRYDFVLHDFNASVIANCLQWHAGARVFEHSPYNWLTLSMVDIQLKFCQHELLLTDIVKENNIMPPQELQHRKFKQRVVIHPTSSDPFRQWLPMRFFKLARWLQQHHYEPIFIVAEHERNNWIWLEKKGFAFPQFSSLHELASTVYESGWFIGNDSGIGHLASNLGIPTLTLGMRKKMLQRWRPSWSHGEVLVPPNWLVLRQIKQRFWKYLISLRDVTRTFEKMTRFYG